MKSVPKLIQRFVSIMLLSSVLLVILNITMLADYTAKQMPNIHPWATAEEIADQLLWDGQTYHLPKEAAHTLKTSNIWAIFIDNKTKQVVWQTDNLPASIPKSYSLSDIASLTRGYIDDYPTFTGEAERGLVVLGYPKDSIWKHLWPSWDYALIAGLPKMILFALTINIIFIFFIYFIANTKLLKSVKPIVNGIQSLTTEKAVSIPEKGLLCELAANINKTSQILQMQSRQLRKKETARANWIAGVSHDIRTPLSMVMGYACQLESNPCLPEEDRRKACVIVRQSERMRNLINDLNLASKLEYHMQPVNPVKHNMIAIVRQVIVDFINMDIDSKYPIKWETAETLTACMIEVDKGLIKRAVSNLIQNCINHNEQGCHIFVRITSEKQTCMIEITDDGCGATDEQIKQLNHSPHYMVCDENTTEQRHGLGLLIVKQIAAVHGGCIKIGQSPYGGFSVKLLLPIQESFITIQRAH